MPNALAAKYSDVKTTRIDTHVLNREPMGAVGPLDRLPMH